MEKDFYTAKDLADKLGMNVMTIYRWIGAKKLKAYKLGKEFRIEKKDFDASLKKASNK
ncbi:MAG: helix-turn-helix domain-containing protein [Candidatus Paceibacterota bacterium]